MVTLVRLGWGDQAPRRGSLGLSAPPQRERRSRRKGGVRSGVCVVTSMMLVITTGRGGARGGPGEARWAGQCYSGGQLQEVARVLVL